MKRSIAAVLCLAFVAPSLTLASVDSKRAAYTGGTATVFNGAKDPIEGDLNTADSAALTLNIRTTLAIMETRTGKKVTYQDEEARKSGLGK